MTHTPHAVAPVKRLTRSRADRQLAGVCGGVASYTGVDATVVRLGAVMITLFTWGIGAVAYLLAAIIMPEEQAGQSPATGSHPEPADATPTYTTPPTEATYPVTVPAPTPTEPVAPQAETEEAKPTEPVAPQTEAEEAKPTENKPTDTP